MSIYSSFNYPYININPKAGRYIFTYTIMGGKLSYVDEAENAEGTATTTAGADELYIGGYEQFNAMYYPYMPYYVL